jgi:hypothetical protein
MLGRGNRSIRRNTAALPLCPPQFPHDLNLARTGAPAEGIRQFIARVTARLSRLNATGCMERGYVPRGVLKLATTGHLVT